MNSPTHLPLIRPRSAKENRHGKTAQGVIFLLIFLAITGGLAYYTLTQKDEPDSDTAAPVDVVVDLVNTENLILALTPELKKLNRSVEDLSLPNSEGKSLFAPKINVTDVSDQRTLQESFDSIGAKSYTQNIVTIKESSLDSLQIWSSVLDQIDADSFRNASFKLVKGHYAQVRDESGKQLGVDRSRFETLMKFDGLARSKSGEWISIHATQNVDWRDMADGDSSDSDWKISSWQQLTFESAVRQDLMFKDVLLEAIPEEHHDAILNSLNDEFIVKLHQGKDLDLPFPELKPFVSSDTMMAHPSVSVVDINNDGWDDLYLMTRWRNNRMFINNQDGTFREAAEELGLDWDRTSCAIFADLDNDGDKDAFLGRCFADSKLLINEDGKFVDRTQDQIEDVLPGFITSVSVADYDNDGLLDMYLSSHLVIGVEIQTEATASRFMPDDHATQMLQYFNDARPADMWLRRPGPPNRLLKNMGNGKFAKSDAIFEIWANTFQATWADYDEDGDVDLYLCNDFAPDYLFRNDGEVGFTDVTQLVGGDAMRGYGMGSTWGDYDNDGHQDLYVSNMYSKAGKRIISQLPDIDPNFLLSANGNRLFHSKDGLQFDLVSGEGPKDQHVTKAGWSWGGQFCDFDNDGYLDIYVSSGFYTAPKEIACDEDL